jgi:hypothetical protein
LRRIAIEGIDPAFTLTLDQSFFFSPVKPGSELPWHDIGVIIFKVFQLDLGVLFEVQHNLPQNRVSASENIGLSMFIKGFSPVYHLSQRTVGVRLRYGK